MFKKYIVDNYNNVEKDVRDVVLNMIDPQGVKKVLDIGSGDGELTQMIAQKLKDAKISAVDNSPAFGEITYRKWGWKAIIADADIHLPFEDESFDLVIASQVIEHVDNTDTFITEMYRVLRKGGICICACPNLASFHSIATLMTGHQSFTCHVSDKLDFGLLFTMHKQDYPLGYRRHRRMFTIPSLTEMFTYYGFKNMQVKGFGYYFLPRVLAKKPVSSLLLAKYAAHIILRAEK